MNSRIPDVLFRFFRFAILAGFMVVSIGSALASNYVDYYQTLSGGTQVGYRVNTEEKGKDIVLVLGVNGSDEWKTIASGITLKSIRADEVGKGAEIAPRAGVTVSRFPKGKLAMSQFSVAERKGWTIVLQSDVYGHFPLEDWNEGSLTFMREGKEAYLLGSFTGPDGDYTYATRVREQDSKLLSRTYVRFDSGRPPYVSNGQLSVPQLGNDFDLKGFAKPGEVPVATEKPKRVAEIGAVFTVEEKGQKFTVQRKGEEVFVTDVNGRRIRYPVISDSTEASLRIEDGILHVEGAERLVDLREFEGEVDLIGDTFELQGFPGSDKEPYPIKATIERAAPDLVAQARKNFANGDLVPLEPTESVTAPKVVGTLYEKQSVKIVGAPGSGKTAEMEIFAEEVALGKVKGVPRTLQIRNLNLGAFSTATQYVGQSESKGQALLAYAAAYKPVFLVDEFHQIAKTGTSMNGGGLAQQIKPELERGKIRFIAISTEAEWSRAFKTDPAFNQRFDMIIHEAPKEEELLKRIRNSLRRQGRNIPPDAVLKRAIELSDRFAITGGQPRSSVNLLKKATAVLRQSGNYRGDLSIEAIESAAVQAYNIDPVYFSREGAYGLVSTLGERIKKRIVGQRASVDAIEETVLRMMSGVGMDGAANVIGYYGPPGTGKTLSSKVMGAEMKMNTGLIAMSAYGNGNADAFRHQLYEILEKSPMSVIILDEINRAPERVQNALLDMINDKKFTVDFTTPSGDHVFREVRCPNVVFVWTTNAGQDLIIPSGADAKAIDPTKISRGTVDKALTEGGVVEALLSRTPTVVGMPRPMQAEFRKALVAQIDELLIRESAKNGIRIRLARQSEFVEYVMREFEEHVSDYRDIATILQRELEPWIARGVLNPETEKSKRMTLDWKPNPDVESHKRCVMLMHHKKELSLRSLGGR